MKRQRALLRYALGALVRRRGRNAAITVGLTLVVGLFASVLFLGDALRAEVEAGTRHVPDLGVQRLVAGRPALIPVDVARAIAAIPGVRAVTPRVWGYLFAPPISANVTVLGADGREALPPTLVAGRALRPGERGACVLGAALADALGVRAGDEIALAGAPGADPEAVHVLRVVGTFRDASALRTADLLVTSDADARALLGVADGFATDLAAALTTPDEARVATEKILQLLPGARVIDKERLRRAYALTLDGRSGLLTAALLPALAALLLLAWDRLTGLTETERRELGVLKAVGWEVRDVLTARVWESALVAVCGATLGVLAAYAYVFLAQAPGLASALFGWSALYPPLRLTPQVDAAQTLALVAGVAVPFVAVSLVPAWRAATLDPDRALRGAG
jgi:putative ABC transport system permease protein